MAHWFYFNHIYVCMFTCCEMLPLNLKKRKEEKITFVTSGVVSDYSNILAPSYHRWMSGALRCVYACTMDYLRPRNFHFLRKLLLASLSIVKEGPACMLECETHLLEFASSTGFSGRCLNLSSAPPVCRNVIFVTVNFNSDVISYWVQYEYLRREFKKK